MQNASNRSYEVLTTPNLAGRSQGCSGSKSTVTFLHLRCIARACAACAPAPPPTASGSACESMSSAREDASAEWKETEGRSTTGKRDERLGL